jgi:hypothetical protein
MSADLADRDISDHRSEAALWSVRGLGFALGVLLVVGAVAGAVLAWRVMAVVFVVRAVGDFHYCGFFKRVRDTAFARYDTLVYSPLCVVIAALAVWLSASG